MDNSLTATIYFHSTLQKHLNLSEKMQVLNFKNKTTIGGVIESLNLVDFTENLLISKNGISSSIYEEVKDKDEIHLILPISGG